MTETNGFDKQPNNMEEVNQILHKIDETIVMHDQEIRDLINEGRNLGRYEVVKFRNIRNGISPLREKISDLEDQKKKLLCERTKLFKNSIVKNKLAYKTYTNDLYRRTRNDHFDFKQNAKLKKQNYMSTEKLKYDNLKEHWNKQHSESRLMYNKKKDDVLADCVKMKYFLKQKKFDVDNNHREANVRRNLNQRTEKEIAYLRKEDNIRSIIGDMVSSNATFVLPTKSFRLISASDAGSPIKKNRDGDIDYPARVNSIQEDQGCFNSANIIKNDFTMNKIKAAFTNIYPSKYGNYRNQQPKSFFLKSSRVNSQTLGEREYESVTKSKDFMSSRLFPVSKELTSRLL